MSLNARGLFFVSTQICTKINTLVCGGGRDIFINILFRTTMVPIPTRDSTSTIADGVGSNSLQWEHFHLCKNTTGEESYCSLANIVVSQSELSPWPPRKPSILRHRYITNTQSSLTVRASCPLHVFKNRSVETKCRGSLHVLHWAPTFLHMPGVLVLMLPFLH